MARRSLWRRLRRATRDPRNAALARAIGGFSRALGALPMPAALAVGRGLGTAAHAMLATPRRLAVAHMGLAFPELDLATRRRLVRATFRHAGQAFAELSLFETILRRPDYIRLEGVEALDTALARGRGAIAVTGHVGNWELLAAWAAAIGYPITVVVRRVNDLRFHSLIVRFRRPEAHDERVEAEVVHAPHDHRDRVADGRRPRRQELPVAYVTRDRDGAPPPRQRRVERLDALEADVVGTAEDRLEQRQLGERLPRVAEGGAHQPPSRREVELREGEAHVGDGEPARRGEQGVRRRAETAADGERRRHREGAQRAAEAADRARQRGVARVAGRATEPAPERAAGHQPDGSDDAGAQQVVEVDNARRPAAALGQDEEGRDRVPLHDRDRLGRERAATDRLGRGRHQVARRELAQIGGPLEPAPEIAVGDDPDQLAGAVHHPGHAEALGGDLDQRVLERRALGHERHLTPSVHDLLDA